MSNSAPPPGSTPPPNQQSPPTSSQSPPPTSPSPPRGSPTPTQGQNSPPPTISKATAPSSSPPSPSGSSSSPPPTGSPPSPPPSSSSGSSSSPPPPAGSSNPPASSPPAGSGSGSSKSPPPSNGNSSNSPPAPPPPAPKSSGSHPPPASPSDSSPPTSSPNSPAFSPPPANSPPGQTLPTPAATNTPPPPVAGNSGSPPAQTTTHPSAGSPPNAIPSPQTPGSPYQSSTQNPTTSNVPPSTSTPPASKTTSHVPNLSPPSSSTLSQSSTSSKSSSTSAKGPAIGITVAGVMIVAFVAFFFVARRRRKRHGEAFVAQYKSSPSNFSGQPDGYYYHSYQHSGGPPGQTETHYGGNFTASPSALGHSYGSHQGYSPQAPEANVMGTKSWFSYEELMEITNGFSRQNILGEGGFGCVYKGWLQDGRIVAVKQLKAGSGQGEREFRAEVEIISRVHHRHLVSLVGYCIADHHRLLVYEFVPNNTLEHHLHGKGMPVMEWSKRVKIALGSARGLAYLHEDCHPKIIHRDIKSANILLDDAFEAQVADFGLAKLTNDTNTHVSTRVMGTFGYMAPEYASSGKLTDRSDVFSFGVVLLEIVTGRKPVDPTQPLGDESLVEWARPLLIDALESGNFEEIVDPRLEKRYVESEMFRLIETAAACVRHSAQKRPRMSQVVRALDTEGDMADLSNGVKYGQSTIFESGPNSEIQRFRRMAFGSSDYSSEYSIYSGENNSREVPHRSQNSWSQNGSSEFSVVGRVRP